MDDESGELMELMEEVPLKELVMQNWRDQCVVDDGKPKVDSRDEDKHTGVNDLLFVDKMWMDGRV